MTKKYFTYSNPVIDYRPQKDDPHRVCITAGGNFINYNGKASVQTTDLNMAKLHSNSVVSMENIQYMCLNIKKKSSQWRLSTSNILKIPLSLFPEWTIDQYKLKTLALDGSVYIEMRRVVWVILQAGVLANKRLRRKLAPFGYYESTNTPGLWCHKTRPITFTLVVNNFGVKFVNKTNVDHLISSIKQTYKLTKDWTGNLYCSIMLEWDYVNHTVAISMPGYIKKMQEYKHVMAKRLQTCPYSPEPKQFVTEAQAPLPPNNSPQINVKRIKRVQKVVGSILYYAQAVDMTILMAFSLIVVEQIKAAERTMSRCRQLLDYLLGHSDAKICFHASDMILNIHLDAPCLSKNNARSRTCCHFSMGWMLTDGSPIYLNRAFHISTTI